MKLNKLFLTMLLILCMVTATASFMTAAEKSTTSAKSGLININTAGADQLTKLPRIGPKMAQRIIDYRDKNGKFKKLEDLMKVTGIGEKTFQGFEGMITLN